MARQYKCVDCKRGFKSQFALTAHIRFCKESKTAKCPECKKSCNKRGLATHRYNKHGVAGTSRWATGKKKKVKVEATPPNVPVETVQDPSWRDQAIKGMRERVEILTSQVKRLELAIQILQGLP